MRNNRHYRGHSALAACTAGILGAVLATSAKAQNLLLDPGFEPDATTGAPNASAGDVPMSTAGPWLGWNNWVSPYSAYYTASVAPHSGTQVGKTFSGPNAGIYQFVNITAGNSYTASAWFDDDASDPFNDTAMTDDVRMIFFSGTGGTGTIGLCRSPQHLAAIERHHYSASWSGVRAMDGVPQQSKLRCGLFVC